MCTSERKNESSEIEADRQREESERMGNGRKRKQQIDYNVCADTHVRSNKKNQCMTWWNKWAVWRERVKAKAKAKKIKEQQQ